MKALNEALGAFEAHLQNHDTRIMRSFHASFEGAFWEMVRNGGKRFRPSLLFCVVLAKAREKIAQSFDIALAIEVLHTYSLIHDDLPAMDNAALRRNHPTLHTKYSEADAILCGDGLNTYAFYLISRADFSDKIKVALSATLAYGALKMVLGQACDCAFERQKLPREKLEFIHINKTAELIAAALKMGAIIAETPDSTAQELYDFGLKLGLFFQIRDDILDKTSSNEGKSANADGDKNSYVNLLGLEGAKTALQTQKTALLESLQKIDSDIAENLQFLLNQYLFK